MLTGSSGDPDGGPPRDPGAGPGAGSGGPARGAPVRVLSPAEAGRVLRWADAGAPGGLDLIGVPPGPVRPVAPSGAGLLATVRLLDTPAGLLAVKSAATGPVPRPWLEPLTLMRREIDALRAAAPVAAYGIPAALAVAPDPGIVVMRGIRPVRHLDQLAGLSVADTLAIAERLGRLHARWLPGPDPWLPFLGTDPCWHGILADYADGLARFRAAYRDHIHPAAVDLLDRLPAVLARSAAATAGPPVTATHAPGTQAPGDGIRIVSMDLRSDNVLYAADGPYFIDWQFAVRAPGAADLAVLLGTSTDADRAGAAAALGAYAVAAGVPPATAVHGFLLGLTARVIMTVPLALHLRHRSPRSRLLRAAAIRRLTSLLAGFGPELAMLDDPGPACG